MVKCWKCDNTGWITYFVDTKNTYTNSSNCFNSSTAPMVQIVYVMCECRKLILNTLKYTSPNRIFKMNT